jgi:ubiquinone/menaquinone biosynthesis C-methylase UbiE
MAKLSKILLKTIVHYKTRFRRKKSEFLEPNLQRARNDLKGFDVSGLAVLDAGCGAGYHLRALSESARLAVGTDINRDNLLKARQISKSSLLVRADLEHLPFKASRFGACVNIVVMPYVNEEAVLQELHRVIKPGGLLLIKHNHPRYLRKVWHKNLAKRTLRVLVPSLREEKDYVYQLKSTTAFDDRFRRMTGKIGFKLVGFENLEKYFVRAIFKRL